MTDYRYRESRDMRYCGQSHMQPKPVNWLSRTGHELDGWKKKLKKLANKGSKPRPEWVAGMP